MRQKAPLNPTKLNEAVQTSTLRKTFSLGLRTIQGGGGGIGASVLVLTLLTLAGITAAFLAEILAAVGGAVVFSLLALGMSYYNLWKDEQKLNGLKAKFDKKLIDLRRGILESIKNYQLLLEAEKNIITEITRLNELVQKITDRAELEQINEKVRALNHDLADMGSARKELVDRLNVTLSIFEGKTVEDRLALLFGKGGEEAILAGALSYPEFKEDHSTIKSGLSHIMPQLTTLPSDEAKSHIYKDELLSVIKEGETKTPKSVKWVTKALTGLGGFLGGAGSVITIAALVLGGMAAVTAVGWPIAVVALGVGLVAAGIALFYQRTVERRQQKTLTKLNDATSQVKGMTKYVNKQINQPSNSKIASWTEKYKQDCRDVFVSLNVHRQNFKDLKQDAVQHTQRIRSLTNEVNKFHKFKQSDMDAVKSLEIEIDQDLVRLNTLLKQVHKVTVIAGSEMEKTNLIHEIEAMIKEVETDKREASEIHKKIDESRHQQLVQPAPATPESSALNESDEIEVPPSPHTPTQEKE